VPGFIDEVMRYTLDTAPYPEPVLAFAGALTLQALLAGRKVRDAMDNRTNLYVLSLANSGVGKDHARKVNARILYEAGLADCLGTSFASGEGIEDRLFVQPATLFQVDEIDGLLMRVSQARDARHEAIVSMLLQMYSSAASVYVMRAKAGRERTEIDQRCLCIFGTAVPKHFYESLSARLMTNGFLARLLILECRGRGVGRDDVPAPPDAAITQPGDLWLLGNHRLLCGDSSNPADVDRLLGGASIHLVNTDPPYNVKVEPRSNNAIAAGLSSFPATKQGAIDAADAGGMHHQGFDLARDKTKSKPTTKKLRAKDRPLANDFVSDEAFDALLDAWFGNMARVLVPGRGFTIWGGYANLGNYPPFLKKHGLYFSQGIVWDKQHPVLTRKDSRGSRVERVGFGWEWGKIQKRLFFRPGW
jgi:hypothetical protein